MNATAEIDKAGRLVVPKAMRDSLHLVPGTRVTFRTEGNSVIVERERKGRGLYLHDGVLVYDSGRTFPPESVDWVEQGREERDEEIFLQSDSR